MFGSTIKKPFIIMLPSKDFWGHNERKSWQPKVILEHRRTRTENAATGHLPSSLGYCAAGATFLLGAALFVPVQKRQKKKVVGEKKSLHQDFAHSLPSQGHRLGCCSPPALPKPAPTVLLPSHHHLFPGTDLCLPRAGKTQTADTLTRENTGGKECVFMGCAAIHACCATTQSLIVKVRRASLCQFHLGLSQRCW